MAEQTFGLLNPNETKNPIAVYNDDGGSAGFVTPYKLATGIMRGTQGVGNSGPQIDSANNRITVGNIVLDGDTNTITTTNDDGSTNGIGLIPGSLTEHGFFATDTAGNVVWKQVGPTGTIHDVTNDKGVILDGKLPDGTYGSVMAKTGVEVTGVFS